MINQMEVRIWEGSVLVKKRVKYIEEHFGITVTKIGRGKEASDNKNIILEEGDYITYNGTNDNCLNLLKATIPEKQSAK